MPGIRADISYLRLVATNIEVVSGETWKGEVITPKVKLDLDFQRMVFAQVWADYDTKNRMFSEIVPITEAQAIALQIPKAESITVGDLVALAYGNASSDSVVPTESFQILMDWNRHITACCTTAATDAINNIVLNYNLSDTVDVATVFSNFVAFHDTHADVVEFWPLDEAVGNTAFGGNGLYDIEMSNFTFNQAGIIPSDPSRTCLQANNSFANGIISQGSGLVTDLFKNGNSMERVFTVDDNTAYAYLFSKWLGAGDNGLRLYHNGGANSITLIFGHATTSGVITFSHAALAEGVPHHLVLTADLDAGWNAKLYLDGQELSVQSETTPVGAYVPNNINALTFFTSSAGSSSMIGKSSLIALWNKVVSASEVTELYMRFIGVQPDSIAVGYGQVLADSVTPSDAITVEAGLGPDDSVTPGDSLETDLTHAAPSEVLTATDVVTIYNEEAGGAMNKTMINEKPIDGQA